MNFIRRHSFIFICAGVAFVGLALAGFGMTRGSDVVQQLEDGRGLARQIDGFLGRDKPATVAAIEQMQGQIERLKQAREAFLEEASRVNRREPLIPGFFPKPEDDGARYAFQDAYKNGFDGFLAELHAGKNVDREELRNWRTMVEEETRAYHLGETPLGFANLDPLVLAQLPDEVRWNHAARASIWVARHSYCFAELTSFDVKASVYQPREGDPPDMDRFWSAQTSLWIQQDIVGALIDLNKARADELARSGGGDQQTPWVGNMPLKQIVGIRVSDYLFEDEEPPEVDEQRLQSIYQKRGFNVSVNVGDPPLDVLDVLTERGGGDEFDVMHVRVVLVVDPRHLPAIIDEILKRNLFSLLSVRYRYVPMSRNHVGLLYGPDPVIQVEMDLAIHWLGDVYFELMPQQTKKRLGFE